MMDGTAKHPIVYFDDAGQGPHVHVCPVSLYVPIEIREGTYKLQDWLDRKRLLGLITPEAAAGVEMLIAELTS